jgi:hypothetical protein
MKSIIEELSLKAEELLQENEKFTKLIRGESKCQLSRRILVF